MLKFRGKAQQREDGLWVARKANELAREMKATITRPGMVQRSDIKRTVYGPTGRPIALVKVSGFGNTEHEFDDHQDAVARPDPVRVDAALMREKLPNPFKGKMLPPPDFMDAEMARLRGLLATNPTPAVWEEYRAAKHLVVSALMERKFRRDFGGF